jgi:hypothetical protein
MKALLIVFGATFILGVQTFHVEKTDAAGRARRAGGTAPFFSEHSLSQASASFVCTCSCGKDCEGTCHTHFENCDLVDVLPCVINCCRSAPNPTKEECPDLTVVGF